MPANKTHYDVIVIGAGPAGFACAIRTAQLGLKTACIDSLCHKNNVYELDGSHLKMGSVASMSLLESAKIYQQLNNDIAQHGISTERLSFDIKRMIQRKDKIVEEITRNMASSLIEHNIEHIKEKATLLNDRQIELSREKTHEKTIIEADYIVLATGSIPNSLATVNVDNEFIIDTYTALNLTSVPKKLAIMGAGVRGLELASIWNRLGADVILFEAQENFLSLVDQQVSAEAYRLFQQQGFDIRLGTRVISAKKDNEHVVIEYQDKNITHTLYVDKLIVACGTKPNSEQLAAPEANLMLDEEGYVYVDEDSRTNLPGVYAIGDLTLLGPMLPHKGIQEGLFVAESIAGSHNPINYQNIPCVIYTEPEIAWAGQNEQTLRAAGEAIKVGVYHLNTNARALAMGKNKGFIKIISHLETDKILGVHMICTHASELISEAVLAMEFAASTEDLASTIHASITLSEAFQEAAIKTG
jgi:dihydrolipoamide dehydrogenase